MCGIAGIMGHARPVESRRVLAALHHRGPDDEGIFVDESASLFHARLSIIDVSAAGHQPMGTADGAVQIVYNGELYNFAAERALLEARGVTFRSHSDTEVVLRMYEAYGDDFVTRMRGMFALAIYDRRGGRGRERLVLARDHLGVKPLLWARRGSALVFASELKAMLATGLVAPAIDPEALRQLLTFGAVMQPRTMLEGVSMLLPGHRLVFERGRERIERYWKLDPSRRADLASVPYPELVDYVAGVLDESVRLQLVSDVPLGAFLSGGVDSTLLVGLMARHVAQPLRTFSMGFGTEGSADDESAAAARTAAHLGTRHERFVVTDELLRTHIRRIAAAHDQPTVDGTNAWLISMAARREVTVAVSGTGGDELFAGYPWFHRMAALRIRGGPVALAGRALRLPVFNRLTLLAHGGERFERLRDGGDFVAHYSRLYQIFGVRGAAHLMAADMRAAARAGRPAAEDVRAFDELPGASTVQRVSALATRGYLANQLLRDIDADSMDHSLEVRVPFLDPVVADVALALPDAAKLGPPTHKRNPTYAESGAKRILIDVGLREGIFPPGFADAPKRGFAMPMDTWLRGALREVVAECLDADTARKRGWFAPRATERLRDGLFAGRISWAQPWLVMMTELWAQEVLDVLV